MDSELKPVVGVLALQGGYVAHAQALERAGAEFRLVKRPQEFAGLDGLIIPGGESTTFLKHLDRNGLLDMLAEFVRSKPTFGTCAGAILLAKEVTNPPQASLMVMDMTVERNAYGRQLDSAILVKPSALGGADLEMVFIRAPRIVKIGKDVEVLARRDGDPVLVRQGHLLAATFHPELSNDGRVHQMFVEAVERAKQQSAGGVS